MLYKVGISSGWWQIGRDPSLLGIAMKIGGLGATGGIQFNQIDLDSVAEFLEPRLKENVKKIKGDLKLEVGIHAEVGKIGALESAERRIWEQAHIRLVEAVKASVDLGIVYINFHLSSEIQVEYEEARLKPFGYQYQVVGPDGKPLWTLGEDKSIREYMAKFIMLRHSVEGEQYRGYSKDVDDWVREAVNKELNDYQKSEEYKSWIERLEEYASSHIPDETSRKEYKDQQIFQHLQERRRQIQQKWNDEYNEREGKLLPEKLFERWQKSKMGQYFVEMGEIGAYMITGFFMKSTGDPLWKDIAKNKNPEESYTDDYNGFNAAIAARYLEGHLRATDHEWNRRYLNGMSVLEWCEKYNIVLCFETPEVEAAPELGGPAEGIYRLAHPMHGYCFVKKMNSPIIKLCIDFEHMLAQKLDPDKIIKELPDDFGKTVYLFHVGEPKPYQGKAHIPLSRGSQAQEIIYDWLYRIKQKGCESAILIFERGSGRSGHGQTPFEVFEQSVLVIRQFAKYLEMNVAPDDLPPEFFGISEQNAAVWKRQLVEMRNHAWDPLEGLIMIPEEKHTFFSKAAVDKGKREEWEKRKFR